MVANRFTTTTPLANGDRLTLIEFERRYAAMSNLKKEALQQGLKTAEHQAFVQKLSD